MTQIPRVSAFFCPQTFLISLLINQLKEFTISAAGQFALSPTIAFIVDENDNYLCVGYDKALYLQNTDFSIGDTNEVTLSYSSTSQSRARAYEII